MIMDFWDTVKLVAVISFLVAWGAFILWWIATMAVEFFGFVTGFQNLELAYLISQEDMESLTRKERKQVLKMEYYERKAFLSERFPNSVPAVKGDTLGANPN
jgi:hypothetical protein